MPDDQIDYDALAAKHGAIQPSGQEIDYDALAAKHGAIGAPQSNLSKAVNVPRDLLGGIGAGAISTGIGAYNLARKIPGADRVLPPVSPEVQGLTQPPNYSELGWPGKVGKLAEQTAEFFVPGGAINRGAKAVEGITTGMKAAPVINTAARSALEAGSAAGVAGVQSGGNPDEMKRAGIAAGAAVAAVPVLGAAVRKVGPAILGKTTGAGEEAIRTAATNPSPQFTKALRGGTDEGDIVGAFRDALTNVKEARGNAYRQQLAQISQQQGPSIDITPIRQELADKLQAFRVRTLPNGDLDFSQSVIPKNEEGIVQSIANDVNGWSDLTPLGVDTLKRRISNYYSPTSDVRALTSTVQNATKRVLHASVPGYSQMTQDYANASDFINKIEQEMSLGPKAQQGTAIRKISYALKQNNEYRKVLTEALDRWTHADLKGQLAGYHLKDTLPKGITGIGSGFGVLGAVASGHLTPGAAVALMANSPRLVGETLAAMAKFRSAVPGIAGGIPKIAASVSMDRSSQAPPPPSNNTQFAHGGTVIPMAKGGVVAPEEQAPEVHSGQDIIRGSSNVPLSAGGLQQAKELAERFKAKGGLDRIISSDLDRATTTAKAIGEATGRSTQETPNLHPWHLGGIEGKPTTEVLDQMNRYISKQPNATVPGRGSKSTHDGESFNTFKRRTLGFVQKMLAELKTNPDEKIALVTHFRVLKLLESWVRRGAPPSMEIDTKHMIADGDPPGTVVRMFWNGDKPALEKVSMKSGAALKGGLYIIRHGKTPWNKESAGGSAPAEAPPMPKSGRFSKAGIWYGPANSKP